VLDLILPKLSGREACKYMKSISPDTPVLILSAVSEVVDKVLLLELGAEDYITKPFSPREPSGAGAGLYSTSAQIGDDRDVYIRRLRGGFPQNDREERRQVDHAHRGRV
jgi:CheY-like chemotaxis protein